MNRIIRWNPARDDMAAMQNVMDRFFDDTWRSFRSATAQNLTLDVHETDTAYQVVTTLPGVTADNLNISMDDDVLTISAVVEATVTPENSRALLIERTSGKFTRSIRLPQPVVADQIEAVLEQGVLTLTLPKSPEAQPKVIPVRVVTHSPSNN